METAANNSATISKLGELVLYSVTFIVLMTAIVGGLAVMEAGGFAYLLAYAGVVIAGFTTLFFLWKLVFWVAAYRHRSGLCDCEENTRIA